MRVGEVVGSYRITGKLGSGGMGAVYLAVHTLIGREAAIKVLLPEFCGNEAIVARFFNEAKATTAIRHPGIVEIYDFGYAEDGAAYLVMERLEGETLRTRLERQKRIGVDQALLIARQVAGALKAAHRLGVVHRDLKPDNVYIVTDPDIHGGERAKILDFGVAKLRNKEGFSENETAEGTIVGVPNYMAPEQCEGAENVDGRADQYSLGCILFEMLCGRPPFEGKVWADVMAKQVRMPPPRPSSLVPGLRPDVEELILKLLSKSPRDRFGDAHQLIARLHELAGLPPPAASGKLKVPLPEESPFESQLGLSSSINNSRAVMSSARRTHALGKREKPHGSQPPGFVADETAAGKPAAMAAKAKSDDELKMTTAGVAPPPKKSTVPPPVKRPTLPPPFPTDSSRASAGRAAVKPPTRPPPVPGAPSGPSGKGTVDPLGQTMRPDALPPSAPTMAMPAPAPASAPSAPMHAQPSGQMQAQPSGQMHAQPSGQMQAQPSGQMQAQPSGQMHAQPSGQMHAQPSGQMHAQPSGQVHAQPSGQMHAQPAPAPYDSASGLPASAEVPAPPSMQAYAPSNVPHADPHRTTAHSQAPQAAYPGSYPGAYQGPYPGGFAAGATPRRRTGKLGAAVIGLALLGGGASAYFIATSSDLADTGAAVAGDGDGGASAAGDDSGAAAAISLDAAATAAAVTLDGGAAAGDGGVTVATMDGLDAGAAVADRTDAAPIVDDETRRRPVSLVTITLESLPKGAKVIRAKDKVRLGETPFTYQIEPQAGSISFILRHKGYQDETVTMPANRSSSKKVPLLRSTGKDRAPTIHDD